MIDTALILAGGFGTRLRSVVEGVPKPLAPVGETPFLHYCLEQLIRHGINKFIFSLHYQAEMIVDYIESLENTLLKNCSFEFSIEPKPLGTGGAVKYAMEVCSISTQFLVLNGDTYLGGNYRPLLSSRNPAIGLTKVEEASRYGSVLIDKENVIVQFKEKDGSNGPGFINAGLYLLDNKIFDKVKMRKVFSMEHDVFPQLVKENKLRGYKITGQFIDIGIPEDYYKFCQLKLNDD